jgi:hypothetical protein
MLTAGSHCGWKGAVAYGAAAAVLRVESADGSALPLTVAVEPRRQTTDPATPAGEVAGVLELEWGAYQGEVHRAEVDVGRGLAFTITARELRARLRNVGGGQAENVPTREWIASCVPGAAARVVPPTRSVVVPGLAVDELSPLAHVPTWAARWSFHRVPEAEVAVLFYDGAGGLLARKRVAAGTTDLHAVPPGADTVRVLCQDPAGVTAGVLRFELAI